MSEFRDKLQFTELMFNQLRSEETRTQERKRGSYQRPRSSSAPSPPLPHCPHPPEEWRHIWDRDGDAGIILTFYFNWNHMTPPPAPPLLHPSTHSSICHLHPPLVISWWPPQEHDDQQDHGEQETPEGIINPELPPVLHTHSHITAALTTIFFTGAFFFLITRTHRQTFGHLKNLCGPDDEDDWSWKNKENHMSFFTSKKTHCNSKLDTFVPMTANMSVLVKCL